MQEVRADRSKKIFLGIDPGVSGAIAAIDETGMIVDVIKMPETMEEIYQCFKAVTDHAPCRAVIELVTGYVGKNKGEGGPNPGARMFTFGKSYGCLIMAMIANGLKQEKTLLNVAPVTWQASLGVLGTGLSYAQRKRRNKIFARDLFLRKNESHRKIIGEVADALLIAEYCRRRFI